MAKMPSISAVLFQDASVFFEHAGPAATTGRDIICDLLIDLDMRAFKKREDCSKVCFIRISYFIFFRSWCGLLKSNII